MILRRLRSASWLCRGRMRRFVADAPLAQVVFVWYVSLHCARHMVSALRMDSGSASALTSALDITA